MKTSLLLTALVMGAGLAGTAQARVVTPRTPMPNIHSRTLVAMATPGATSLLSKLDRLLSSTTTQMSGNTQADDHGPPATAGKSRRHPSPDPAHIPATGPRTHAHSATAGGHADFNPPPVVTPSGRSQPAPSPPPPDLGWQSLLPGSIQ